jgi:hypothetical protein
MLQTVGAFAFTGLLGGIVIDRPVYGVAVGAISSTIPLALEAIFGNTGYYTGVAGVAIMALSCTSRVRNFVRMQKNLINELAEISDRQQRNSNNYSSLIQDQQNHIASQDQLLSTLSTQNQSNFDLLGQAQRNLEFARVSFQIQNQTILQQEIRILKLELKQNRLELIVKYLLEAENRVQPLSPAPAA